MPAEVIPAIGHSLLHEGSLRAGSRPTVALPLGGAARVRQRCGQAEASQGCPVEYGRWLRFGRDRGAAGRRVRPAMHDGSGSSNARQPTDGAVLPSGEIVSLARQGYRAVSQSRPRRSSTATATTRPTAAPDPEAVESRYTALIGASLAEPTSLLPVWGSRAWSAAAWRPASGGPRQEPWPHQQHTAQRRQLPPTRCRRSLPMTAQP